MHDELINAPGGDTAEALVFFRDRRWQLGEIVSAATTVPQRDGGPFTLVLRDDRGTRMLLSGPPAGAIGDGASDFLQILLEAGFAAAAAQAVRTHEFVRLTRTADGTTALECANRVPGQPPPRPLVGAVGDGRPERAR